MEISRQDYERILQKDSAGELAILIDVSGWRHLLVKVDTAKLAALAGLSVRDVRGGVAVVRILTLADLSTLLIAALLAIPAFGLWSLVVVPITIIVGTAYKSMASVGRQRVLLVGIVFMAALALAILQTSWTVWLRAYIVLAAAALLLMRMLYVVTNVFVFQLIYKSYDFFKAFYLQPQGAMLPLIYTEPEYSGTYSANTHMHPMTPDRPEPRTHLRLWRCS